MQIDLGEEDLRRSSSSTGQDQTIIDEMAEEIERQLTAKAAKSNLTAINVKHILKHVITNEHVKAMVQRELTSNSSDEVLFTPKLTRAKAK